MRPDEPAPHLQAMQCERPARPGGALRPVVPAGALCLLLLGGCTGNLLSRQHAPPPAPVIPPVAAHPSALDEDLELLQRLVQAPAAEQAEIVAAAEREYQAAPTPSRELRLALILAAPGHPATDRPRAQELLRDLMANPEVLEPPERSLVFLQLAQIDDHLTVEAENRRLQADAARADRERVASANHRLQSEMDENARLRKELGEARAKLDAIANIERSLNERKPASPINPGK